MTAVQKILYDELGMRKLCARWIPLNLKIEQNQARVKWCKEMLKKLDKGASNLVFDIVTGDKPWMYSYEAETKRQSDVWVFDEESNPTKVARSRNISRKTIASFYGHGST